MTGGTNDVDLELLIRQIQIAFDEVRRGIITIHEAEVIDSYGSKEEMVAARKLDRERRWQDVPDGHIEECSNALCHVDPTSWRYYIAAYMVWALRNFRTSDSIVSDHTIYAFNPYCDDPALNAHSMARFQELNKEQSAAVCRFLRYMAANGDHADDSVAHRALQSYWGKFCEAEY
jgi:hypothetical protein